MNEHPAFKNFLKTTQQRHDDVKDKLLALRSLMVRSDRPSQKAAAERAMSSLQQLAQMFVADEMPHWIFPIIEHVGKYRESLDTDNPQDGHAVNLQEQLFSHHAAIHNERLGDNYPTSSKAVEFDAVFEQVYNASQIPQLFDRLIELLQEIINSGEVDSIRATTALQTLIELLQKNRNSTPRSAKTTWDLVKVLTWNILSQYAEDNPVIGPAIKGVKKTFSEGDVKFEELESAVIPALQRALKIKLARIGQSPDSQPPRLPGPVADDRVDDGQKPDDIVVG